jgi:preprotein translocase subunit SecG
MYQIILLFHVFVAVCIIALVLVQQGKGATMGAAFGSGASTTVFGSRGSGSFLFRITISLGAVFFLTSIGLNYIAMHYYRQEKVITLPAMPARSAPATNAAPAANNNLTGNIEIPGAGSIPVNGASGQTPASTTPSVPGEIPVRKN